MLRRKGDAVRLRGYSDTDAIDVARATFDALANVEGDDRAGLDEDTLRALLDFYVVRVVREG